VAWTYECQGDGTVLRADTKEALADQIMHHVHDKHNQEMDHHRAMQLVAEGGRQTP